MNYDLIEIWIIVLKFLKGLLLVHLEHLLFDAYRCSFIFLLLLLQVIIYHIF